MRFSDMNGYAFGLNRNDARKTYDRLDRNTGSRYKTTGNAVNVLADGGNKFEQMRLPVIIRLAGGSTTKNLVVVQFEPTITPRS